MRNMKNNTSLIIDIFSLFGHSDDYKENRLQMHKIDKYGIVHHALNNKCFLGLLLCFVMSACSTTKNLPEGETLYAGIDKLDVVNEDKTLAGITTLEEVEAALAYAPNNAILGSSSLRWP